MRKHFDVIALVITALTVLLAVAFMHGEQLGIQTVVDADAEGHSDDSYFTDNDLNGSWDTTDATSIVLNGDTATISGGGAYAWDGNVTIGASGTYVVSGALDDGSLNVDANDNSKVWILLDGVSITCSDDACIVVDQADKVFLTLANGSTNTLKSGETMGADALEDNTDGVIFAHDDLTINGGGSLLVEAAYKHGVSANDDLVITGGAITVSAPKDGLHANDSLRVCGATLEVAAADDGLAVDNEGGYLYVESGQINVKASDEGMVAVGDVTVAGGSIEIASGTERGHHGIKSGGTCAVSGGTVLVSACYEGIAANDIDVTSGDVTVYPTDDGLNASTGDNADGFGMGGGMGSPGGGMGGPAPGDLTGNPAQRDATGEAPTSTNNAEPVVTSSDASGDTEATELPWIHVSGGTITVVNEAGNDADGLDSNGNIIITGGDIRVSMLGNGGNNAIDFASENGGICQINGGTVVACGSSGMVEAIDSSSAQCSVMYGLSEEAVAGTTVSLVDATGATLLSYVVPCSFTCVTLSCPEMTVGETYSVVIGDSTESVAIDEVATSSGAMQNNMGAGGFAQGGGPAMRRGDGTEQPQQDGTEVQFPRGDAGQPQGDGTSQPQRPQEMGTSPEADTPESVDDAATSEASAAQTEAYTTETLVVCGVSVVVLAVGIVIVRVFRRH